MFYVMFIFYQTLERNKSWKWVNIGIDYNVGNKVWFASQSAFALYSDITNLVCKIEQYFKLNLQILTSPRVKLIKMFELKGKVAGKKLNKDSTYMKILTCSDEYTIILLAQNRIHIKDKLSVLTVGKV